MGWDGMGSQHQTLITYINQIQKSPIYRQFTIRNISPLSRLPLKRDVNIHN